jgi:hypothetical protein
MCRSIKPLRKLEGEVTSEEIYEAALQYVRKVSGYRKPSRVNEVAFNLAVDEISHATQHLLENLVNPLKAVKE